MIYYFCMVDQAINCCNAAAAVADATVCNTLQQLH